MSKNYRLDLLIVNTIQSKHSSVSLTVEVNMYINWLFGYNFVQASKSYHSILSKSEC